MDWEPRKSKNVDGPLVDVRGIDGPPCVACGFWRPQKTYFDMPDPDYAGDFAGIRCCWAKTQLSDFTCFEPRAAAPAPGSTPEERPLARAADPGRGREEEGRGAPRESGPASPSAGTSLPRGPSRREEPGCWCPIGEPGAQGPVGTSGTTRPGEESPTFVFCGQLRHRCLERWPNGAPCRFDTYDPELLDAHKREIHARKKVAAPPMPTLFDAEGELVTRDRLATEADDEPDSLGWARE